MTAKVTQAQAREAAIELYEIPTLVAEDEVRYSDLIGRILDFIAQHPDPDSLERRPTP